MPDCCGHHSQDHRYFLQRRAGTSSRGCSHPPSRSPGQAPTPPRQLISPSTDPCRLRAPSAFSASLRYQFLSYLFFSFLLCFRPSLPAPPTEGSSSRSPSQPPIPPLAHQPPHPKSQSRST